MAPCHPKLKTHPGAELFLSRFADGDWRGIIRPWLESGRGRLERSIVVAPTRGHTQALKQRCVDEGVSLLGVEFLTPGLARRKCGIEAGLGRSLQVLVLRSLLERRLAGLPDEDPARGLWKSLASDLESAIAEFEDLLRAGFGPESFRLRELRELFVGFLEWLVRHGLSLGPLIDRQALAGAGDSPRLADRLLVLAGGPEGWPEFLGLLALAGRCPRACVLVAEPEFGGRSAAGEEWVGLWEKALGVDASVADVPDPAMSCSPVAELWMGGEGSAGLARAIVARSRTEEMELVADEVAHLLSQGSDAIAVVFPGPGAGQARLARLLEDRGVAFADLIGVAGTPPVDTRIERALAEFFRRGCRLEELLALWPLLRSVSLTQLEPGRARAACQRLFDEVQSHALEPNVGRLVASDSPDSREVGRVAAMLMPPWPATLSPVEALERFSTALERLGLADPEGWSGLRDFAGRASGNMPAAALLEAILAFLPEKGPMTGSSRRNGFARVTLTTCRRAAGVSWSDCIFAESNAGTWPERREPSCWLGDEDRRQLSSAEGRLQVALPTSDDRAALEKRLYCSIARDTRRRVIFTAALFSEEEPEVRLGPNVWLERVMWAQGLFSGADGGSGAFERLASPRIRPRSAAPAPAAWGQVWARRRDPAAPFDAFFFGDPGGSSSPARLSASQIERGIRDPASLWFDAVLGVARIEWRPFARMRGKAVGTAVHRALAAALRGAPAEGSFSVLPELPAAEERLRAELARLRGLWPADRYWDSFHGDVAEAARALLARVYELPRAPFGAVEVRLPGGATVPVSDSAVIGVSGQMDLVLSDRPGWAGAQVEIVDYKTGGDPRLSAARMESSGSSLQLGVYLQAAHSVGACGAVWMLKPDDRPARVGMDELGKATAKLRMIGRHLSTGIYGARTADRDEYTHIFEWPLACPPVPYAILESKFAATFGAAPEGGADD